MWLDRMGIAGLCALPGALTVYFAFNGGGFFPAQPALVAVVLALVLVVWTVLVERPYAGMTWLLAVASSSLALFALWTLASGRWSHAPGRAIVEYSLALVYVLAVVLFGAMATTTRRLRWMVRGVAFAAIVVCVAALATRLYPDAFHVAANIARQRLSFPISYWNTLGLLAAMGIVLCLHLSASEDEPRPARAAAAVVVPVLATVLYFTFSRAAIGVVIGGLVVYCALSRSRLLVTGLLAVAPPTVGAVVAGYHADLLAKGNHRPTVRCAP